MAEWIDLALRGGTFGLLAALAWLLWNVKGHFDREENLKRNYPPHRHINGTRIIYPQEYRPAPIEHLAGSGD